MGRDERRAAPPSRTEIRAWCLSRSPSIAEPRVSGSVHRATHAGLGGVPKLSDPSYIEVVSEVTGPWWALAPPLHHSIRGEHLIPKIQRDTEVAAPHVVAVVEVVDRSGQPEYEIWVLVLHLVGVGRRGGVGHRTGGKTQASRDREQEAESENRDSGNDVIVKLTPPSLTGQVSVMLGVAYLEDSPRVHQAVSDVLGQRSNEYRNKPGTKEFDEKQRVLHAGTWPEPRAV